MAQKILTHEEIEKMSEESFERIHDTPIPEFYNRQIGKLDDLAIIMEEIEIYENIGTDPERLILYMKDFITWRANYINNFIKEGMKNG